MACMRRIGLCVILANMLFARAVVAQDFGFEAMFREVTDLFPPDVAMAVSPEYIVVASNQDIAAFEKDGTELWSQRFFGATDGFWSDLPSCSDCSKTGIDPLIVYDSVEDRFWVTAFEQSGLFPRHYLLVAVSSTEDPAEGWNVYRVDLNEVPGINSHEWRFLDRPN